MKSRGKLLGVLAALVIAANAAADNEIPGQDEYAWSFPIRIEQPAEFMATVIPLEVYRSVTDPGLRDLGVYNRSGHAVPRIIRQPRETVDDIEYPTPLGMVPLYGELQASQERLRLLMQSNAAGTTLQFDSNIAEPLDPSLELRAVIVDLRDIENAFQALEFEWAVEATGFIGNVTIDEGDDLARWRRLAEGTLAELEFEGTRIEQRRIELPRESGDFLRITWREMPRDWRLEAVTGIRREAGPEHAREWITLDPIERSEDGRSFIFDIGGYPPVDRVDLQLPGQNVAVRAAIDLSHRKESGWLRAHEGLFYRVSRSGHEISSKPARQGRGRAERWRVTILSGQVAGDVQLRLGWLPEQLLFLSQGEPPFMLASGRARDRVERFPQDRLLGDKAIFSMLDRAGEPGTAMVGARIEAAGAMVMKDARTWTWRTIAVWIGLVAAVLLVGWLAWSLMRETK